MEVNKMYIVQYVQHFTQLCAAWLKQKKKNSTHILKNKDYGIQLEVSTAKPLLSFSH